MDAERWRRAQALFHAATALPPEARAAFVRSSSDGDAGLEAEVARLLAADAPGTELLDAPAGALLGALAADALAAGLAPDPRAGRRLGEYTLLRELGRGGMGVVYLAERADVGLRCALKVVLGELAAPENVARFLLERRLLARLEHPHIARFLDAGVTDDGAPWFAMERIDGVPIDRHCDNRRLTIAERLRLFEDVCDAVAYAHRNLIVHRDLKPSNILVSVSEGPKLVDFGIARMLDDDAPGLTRTRARVMTPEYAAPEQLSDGPATTATDVYALGLVLYRLLTGRSGRAGAAHDGASPQGPPRRPSAVVLRAEAPAGGVDGEHDGSAALAAARRMTPRELSRRLAGDLDAIVLRALAHEPARRYGTAAELLDDVRRHRTGLPVRARPDTWAYRTRVFVMRNRAPVAAATLLLLLLVGFAVAMTVQQAATARERDRAEAALARADLEATKATHVSDFLIELFSAADPYAVNAVRADSVSVRDFLIERGERVSALAPEPEVQLAALNVVGRMYMALELFDAAERTLGDAVALGERLYPAGHPDLVGAHTHLGALNLIRQRHDEAERRYRLALEMADRIGLGAHRYTVTARHQLGDLLRQRGRFEEADAVLRTALDARIALWGAGSVEASDGLNNLALVHWARHDLDPAATMFEEALAIQRDKLPQPHAMTAAVLNNLGLVRLRQGDLEAAERAMRESVDLKRQLFEAGHGNVLLGVFNLAEIMARRGDFDEAERLLGQVRAGVRANHGERHDLYAASLLTLGEIRERQRRFEAAEHAFRAAALGFTDLYGTDHTDVHGSHFGLARVLVERGEVGAAVPLLAAVAAEFATAHGEDRETTLHARAWLGAAHALAGDRARAEPLLRGVIEANQRLGAPDSESARLARRYLDGAVRASLPR